MKVCTKCGQEKDMSMFYKQGTGTRPDCKDCRSAYMQAYGAQDHARRNSISNVRKFRYGISEQEYQKMLDDQNGVCAICRQPETCRNISGTIKNLSVDHDHRCCPEEKSSCGKCLRGLLCAGCNRGIGYMKDDVSILLDAATYLMAFENVLVGGDYFADY